MSFPTFCRKLRGWRKKSRPVIQSPIPEIFITTRKTLAYPVGVFSDPHIPFDHPNYLRFCADTFRRHGVQSVICCGDLVDFHAISRHQTETVAKSACDELDMTIVGVKRYTDAFPELDLILGNHDMRLIQQAALMNIDKRFLKSYSELFKLPRDWRIREDEYIFDSVLYKHGINCCGKDGAINAAISERMSLAMGHTHAFAGCKYSANKRDIIFGLNVGCGIDIAAYAFTYGKHDKNRPILGCGIVYSNSHSEFIPMGSEYFRN
jgi:predicted phosphodiesterase